MRDNVIGKVMLISSHHPTNSSRNCLTSIWSTLPSSEYFCMSLLKITRGNPVPLFQIFCLASVFISHRFPRLLRCRFWLCFNSCFSITPNEYTSLFPWSWDSCCKNLILRHACLPKVKKYTYFRWTADGNFHSCQNVRVAVTAQASGFIN